MEFFTDKNLEMLKSVIRDPDTPELIRIIKLTEQTFPKDRRNILEMNKHVISVYNQNTKFKKVPNRILKSFFEVDGSVKPLNTKKYIVLQNK